jgi:D-amino-acid dehydrogenase
MTLPVLNKSDVLIIGGGVIGLSAAYELSKKGIRVTVVDKGEIGQGCSYGNAGWITPCFAMPLPQPGMLVKSVKWLLDPDSPLYIKPDANPLLMKWLMRFTLSMNHKLMRQSVGVLTKISQYSLQEYEKLSLQYPGEMGFEKKGLLMVAGTDEGVQDCVHEMNLVAEYGVPGKQLSAAEVKELEPALTGDIKGGVYFPEEAHAEPLKVVQTLAKEVRARGGVIIENTEVFEFVKNDQNKITHIKTTRGDFYADRFVLATGSWSTALGKQLGINIPIMGGKGYSMIVKPFTPTPKIPIMILDKKIAVTPRNGTVRIAGTLELVDQDFSITNRRVKTIMKGAQTFMNVPKDIEVYETWRGLRPCTPDGVPVIGAAPTYQNLWLCCGHQMLGLQSAPGSGRLLADLMTGSDPIVDPEPFKVSRF